MYFAGNFGRGVSVGLSWMAMMLNDGVEETHVRYHCA